MCSQSAGHSCKPSCITDSCAQLSCANSPASKRQNKTRKEKTGRKINRRQDYATGRKMVLPKTSSGAEVASGEQWLSCGPLLEVALGWRQVCGGPKQKRRQSPVGSFWTINNLCQFNCLRFHLAYLLIRRGPIWYNFSVWRPLSIRVSCRRYFADSFQASAARPEASLWGTVCKSALFGHCFSLGTTDSRAQLARTEPRNWPRNCVRRFLRKNCARLLQTSFGRAATLHTVSSARESNRLELVIQLGPKLQGGPVFLPFFAPLLHNWRRANSSLRDKRHFGQRRSISAKRRGRNANLIAQSARHSCSYSYSCGRWK